jgi:hypothetical protein
LVCSLKTFFSQFKNILDMNFPQKCCGVFEKTQKHNKTTKQNSSKANRSHTQVPGYLPVFSIGLLQGAILKQKQKAMKFGWSFFARDRDFLCLVSTMPMVFFKEPAKKRNRGPPW